MTKRVLVALLVAVVVAGTASTAFGAGFSDTKGTKYEGAVGILSSLVILNGFPDGTFKPGETITRAQFAKAAVCALGLEGAAEFAAGVTIFSDVPATHWAAGYINVAADQGLIKGFPDGTFKPENPVMCAEAMAIIVRALGYDPMVKGVWPTNYLVKAAEIGVSTGLSFSANAPATRGDVALMFENALDIGLMEQLTAGDIVQYAVTNETLLDKLGYDSDTGWVNATPIVFDSDLEPDEVVISGERYELAEGMNLDAQLGLEVRFWYDDDWTIIYAQTLTKPADIITGVIEDIAADGEEVEVDGETYDGSFGFGCIFNYVDYFDQGWPIFNDDPKFMGADATLVLDEGRIAFLQAMKFGGSVVISDVNTRFERLDSWNHTGGNRRFEMDDFESARFLKDGEEIDFEDLAELDVAHYFYILDPPYLYMLLVDDKVSGELEEVSVDADDDIIVTVDGEEYALADDCTLSTDDNDTIDEAAEDGMEDFVGNEVELYLNRDGDARHIVGDFVVESESFAGLVKTECYVVDSPDPTEDDQYFVKLFGFDGEITRCEITEDTEFDGTPVALGEIGNGGGDDYDIAYPIASMVEFTLDKNGALATVDAVDEDFTFDLDAADIHADAKLVAGERVTSGSVFVDVDAWEIVPWDTFKTAAFTSACDDTDGYDGGDITLEHLVFDPAGHGVAYDVAEADTGIVLGRKVTADGIVIRVLIEDIETAYNVGDIIPDDSLLGSNYGPIWTETWSDIDVGDLVTFEYEGDEFTDLYEELPAGLPFKLNSYWVEDVDEDDLILTLRNNEDPEIAGTLEVLLDEDCVVYDVTGTTPVMVELAGLAADQVIQAFDLNDDELIDIIKIIE